MSATDLLTTSPHVVFDGAQRIPPYDVLIDMIDNSWLVNESFRIRLRGILVEAAESLGLRSPETA